MKSTVSYIPQSIPLSQLNRGYFILPFHRRQWKDNLEVEYKLDIPYDHFFVRGLEYKYLVEKSIAVGEKKVKWECYVKSGSTGEGANRTLHIPEKLRSNLPGNFFYI